MSNKFGKIHSIKIIIIRKVAAAINKIIIPLILCLSSWSGFLFFIDFVRKSKTKSIKNSIISRMKVNTSLKFVKSLN